MAARLSRLLVALGLLFGTALPSAAATVVRPPTSQDIAVSPVPDRGADAANARSYFGARYYWANVGRFTTVDPLMSIKDNLPDPQRWNRYAYAVNNPFRYVDQTGESPTLVTAAIGASIGGVAGFLGSAGAQFVSNGYSFTNFSWQDAGALALGGAVSGGLAGATLGLSLVVEAGAGGVIAVSAATNVVGGAVTRATDSQVSTSVLDGKAIAVDAIAGGAGGALGKQAGNAVTAPVAQMQQTAAGMVPAARAGNFGAARGIQGIANRVGTLEARGNVIATVVGAKVTNVLVPIGQALKEDKGPPK